MMKITFAGTTYECTRAVRGETSATLYLAETEAQPGGGTVEFIGVSDWSAFTVEGGEWETPPPTEAERLRADVDFIMVMEGWT